jgi:calcineurin-like phosphoesterase family protein
MKKISVDPHLFYKPLKVESENVLFWGCLHLMHDPLHWEVPLWKQRGYNSAVEHMDSLIEKWNYLSDSETIGFLLGDNAFGRDAEKTLQTFFKSINFKTIYMMAGNHYAGFSKVLDKLSDNIWKIDENKQVIIVPNYLELFVCGKPVVCSHYPILSYNGQAQGSFHLHSHVHGNLGKSEIGRMYKQLGRVMEVSVETAPSPLPWDFINSTLSNKIIFSPDHHQKDTMNPF